MKRLTTLTISLLFIAATGWAQSGMTDNQVMDYVIEQNAKGVSRQQIHCYRPQATDVSHQGHTFRLIQLS